MDGPCLMHALQTIFTRNFSRGLRPKKSPRRALELDSGAERLTNTE